MPQQKLAVVVGALGVIGRYIVERLLAEEGWSVVGVSRRDAPQAPRYRHIPLDLLDNDACGSKLAGLTDATHVFYAAFQASQGAAADYASNIAPNRDMLVNAVTAVAQASPAGSRERSPSHAARLLFRSDRLVDRVPARQGVGLGGAAPADAVRLRTRYAHEHSAGDRRLRGDLQGAGPAAALPWQ